VQNDRSKDYFKNRKVFGTGDGYELKENVASYSADFGAKMSTVKPENSFK
jgi:hypothetical protein